MPQTSASRAGMLSVAFLALPLLFHSKGFLLSLAKSQWKTSFFSGIVHNRWQFGKFFMYFLHVSIVGKADVLASKVRG